MKRFGLIFALVMLLMVAQTALAQIPSLSVSVEKKGTEFWVTLHAQHLTPNTSVTLYNNFTETPCPGGICGSESYRATWDMQFRTDANGEFTRTLLHHGFGTYTFSVQGAVATIAYDVNGVTLANTSPQQCEQTTETFQGLRRAPLGSYFKAKASVAVFDEPNGCLIGFLRKNRFYTVEGEVAGWLQLEDGWIRPVDGEHVGRR